MPAISSERLWSKPRGRVVGASLTLAATGVILISMILPTSASAIMCGSSRFRIQSFTPNSAKAGSNTVIMVKGSALRLTEAGTWYVGPKGMRTAVSNFNYADNIVMFTVSPGTVTGPLSVDVCGATWWSTRSLRVTPS